MEARGAGWAMCIACRWQLVPQGCGLMSPGWQGLSRAGRTRASAVSAAAAATKTRFGCSLSLACGPAFLGTLQVDATPDSPARGEMREKATPAKTGTPIEGMIIGANSNTYLRRGATFDVMRNVEAGVEDTGVWLVCVGVGGAAVGGDVVCLLLQRAWMPCRTTENLHEMTESDKGGTCRTRQSMQDKGEHAGQGRPPAGGSAYGSNAA